MSRTSAHISIIPVFASVAVRDTNPLTSAAFAPSGGTLTLVINNTLSQAGNYQITWSPDGTTYTNVGTTNALAATTNVTTVTGTPWLIGFGLYKITYTASVAPASGTLYMALQASGV